MGVNKVEYFGKVLIDLTEDTVTPETLAKGITAHNAKGEVITGTMESGGTEDLNDVLTEQDALIEELKEVLRGKASGGGSGIEDGLIDGTIAGEYTNDRVTEFRRYAFYRCYDLTKINAPNVETVGQYACSECTSLVEISFPKVTTLGQSVFVGCTSLVSAEFLLITTLYSHAFSGCTALKKVKCGSLKTINAYAFKDCTNLDTLILKSNSLCTLANKNAISDTNIADGTGYIYVPKSLLSQYASATNWSTYENQIRAIEDYPEICAEVSV